MKQFLLVFLGGGLGSALRYWVGSFLNSTENSFPLGTFLVNIIGSLLIGIVLGFVLKNSSVSEGFTLLFVAGFCGGFTTFSAFVYENVSLLKSGDITTFALYTIGSLVMGIAAVFLGMWLARLF